MKPNALTTIALATTVATGCGGSHHIPPFQTREAAELSNSKCAIYPPEDKTVEALINCVVEGRNDLCVYMNADKAITPLGKQKPASGEPCARVHIDHGAAGTSAWCCETFPNLPEGLREIIIKTQKEIAYGGGWCN